MARRGEGVRAIAKQLGCSRNTVRRYLREQQVPRYGPRAARACKLDDYKDYLLARIEQARPRWIHRNAEIARDNHSWAGKALMVLFMSALPWISAVVLHLR